MRVVMLLLGLLLALPLPVRAAEEQLVRVFRVFDGDRLLVRTRYHSHRIQLAGIDAPELDQPGGLRSQQILEKMVLGKRVVMTVAGENTVGEPLVKLQLHEYDIAIEMLRAGAAWVAPEGGPELRAAEDQARAAAKGIWGEQVPPVPPWEWRAQAGPAE